MTDSVDIKVRRLPTLVQICQRASVTNIDYISNLGDDLSFDLAKPILECCNPEQLLVIEESSPHLQAGTRDIWMNLCHSVYPLALEKYPLPPGDRPGSWKDHFFFLRESEARRLEEATAKLRNQRLEAEERKKEREVKITDRVPPSKRPRIGWGSNPAPKSLFQKTRSEASRLQKNMYHARMIPPMPQSGRQFTVLPKLPNTTVEFFPPSTSSDRVTVTNVIQSRPTTSATVSSSSAVSSVSYLGHAPPPVSKSRLQASPTRCTPPATGSPGKAPSVSSMPPISSSRLAKAPALKKKDPMASLFVPKRRAQC